MNICVLFKRKMFEKLLQKRVIRDFLQKYSEDQWSGVIRAVFEIGVLTLQNSFGTLNYSKKDFDNIISISKVNCLNR